MDPARTPPCTLHKTNLFLSVLALFLVLLGCENTIEPFAGHAEPYSVYGAMELDKLRHFVRVRPTGHPVSTVSGKPLPVRLQVENLSSGHTHHLKDSVMVFGTANTHNYWADFRVEPETEYRLTLRDQNGIISEATTVTPTDTDAKIDPDNPTFGPPSDTVSVTSDSLHCRTAFTVLFRDAKVPYRAKLSLEIGGQRFWVRLPIYDPPSGSAPQRARFFMEGLLDKEFDIDGRDDPDTCRYYETRCAVLTSSRLRIAYEYLGPNWFGNRPSPDSSGGFSPVTAGQIDGALGFFGSYRRDTVSTAIHRGTIDLTPDACGPMVP